EINKFLKKRWGNIKPVLPIASGGLHPGLIPKLYKIIGPDMIMNFGGGLHGHPEGSYQGAIAVNEAITATMNNKTLEKYANSHKALALALKKWGRK
ncbi:ribulose-bisphosphate carboxylase large subunit, partial [Patescibacteria group bacterium]|nr:ribulose-bisphosphate carboxylase large subunit [Patescibacteria group bacterium]